MQQLEHLDGTERAIRIGLLSQKDLRAARMLTVVGAHLEYSLWIGLLILLYALIPQQVQVDWHWMNLLGLESPQLWIDHLTNLFYALALVLWEPVYVACGFTLYLNRRTVLEAWDIELVFRRLRQRLIGSAYVLLIGVGLGLSIAPAPAWADPQEYSCPLPDRSEVHATPSLAAPDTPRLTRQTLTSDASRHKINEVLQQPPFKNLKTETGWRFPEKKQPGKPSGREHHDQGWLIKWLDRLMLATHGIARFVEVLLWAAVLGLSGLLIWRYRRWVTTFVSRGTGRKKAAKPRPDQLFGLQVSAESLPDDVAGQAEQLWNSQPREALGLLYRALLSRLLTDYRLPLKNADTEGQVLQRIASLNQPLLSEFSQTLTRHWQALAYGHRLPPAHLRQELCDGWRRFGDEIMSRRNTVPIGILIGVLVVALLTAAGIYLSSHLERYEKTVDHGPAPEAKANPWLAAEQFLRGLSVPVSTTDTLLQLPDPRQGTQTKRPNEYDPRTNPAPAGLGRIGRALAVRRPATLG